MPFAGQLVAVDLRKETQQVLASDLGFSPGVGVNGGAVYMTRSMEPTEEEPLGAAELIHVSRGGQVRVVADLLAHELAENPDGQVQFDPESGEPYDAVSNPYDVLALPGRFYVADAGANAILEVRPNGEVSTLTALLLITDNPDCAEAPNNPGTTGCDPVPTGIALGPDGFLYVSGLGAEVEGQIWKIDPRTGEIVEQWGDLPPLTDIAVAPDGAIYVASLFTSQVFRIGGDEMSSVEIAFPTAVTFANGTLYVAGLQFPDGFEGEPVGVVYAVPPSTFS